MVVEYPVLDLSGVEQPEAVTAIRPPRVHSERDNLPRVIIKDGIHGIFDGIAAPSARVGEVFHHHLALGGEGRQ